MQNGTASLLFFLRLPLMGVLGFIALVKFSMLSCICCEAAVLGACFPTICLPGKPCLTTFVYGGRMASSNGFIPRCASKCVSRWGAKRNQAQASLRANASKPLDCVALMAMTLAAKIKGRKRHLLVDTQGFVLKAKVHPADIMDREGVMLLVDGAATQFPRLRHVWLDAGDNGRGKGQDWIEMTLGWTAKIVQHPPKPRYVWLPKGVEPDWDTIMVQLPPPGFHVLPHRWIVERTFSWLGQNRRLSKDYEQHCESEEAWIYIAMTRLMARRLAAA